jgi:hypothetical protein
VQQTTRKRRALIGWSILFSYEPGELFVWLVHDLEREKIDVL